MDKPAEKGVWYEADAIPSDIEGIYTVHNKLSDKQIQLLEIILSNHKVYGIDMCSCDIERVVCLGE